MLRVDKEFALGKEDVLVLIAVDPNPFGLFGPREFEIARGRNRYEILKNLDDALGEAGL